MLNFDIFGDQLAIWFTGLFDPKLKISFFGPKC